MLIRLPQTAQAEQGANLSADVPRCSRCSAPRACRLSSSKAPEIVGPTVGAELRRQAIYATLLSMLGITAWIAFASG